MKNVLKLALAAAAAFGISTSAMAQEATGTMKYERRNVIKFNPISLAVSTANISYERTFSDKYAGQLGVAYTWGYQDPDANGFRYQGFSVMPEFRIHLFDHAGDRDKPIQGFFAAPFARWQGMEATRMEKLYNASGDPYDFEAQYYLHNIQLGVTGGYELIIGRGLSVEGFVGPYLKVYSRVKNEALSGEQAISKTLQDSPFTRGVGCRAGINVGYAF